MKNSDNRRPTIILDKEIMTEIQEIIFTDHADNGPSFNFKNKNRLKKQSAVQADQMREIQCWQCQEFGHFVRQCPNEPK